MIRSCVDCISFLAFLCFLGIMIVNIVLSSIIIHQKITNSFKEALNHNQHLLLSLSVEQFFGSSPLSFGSTSYYTKDKVPHTKWKGTTLYANQLDSNYLSLLDSKSISKDNQCPEGSHQCGILDTVDNVLCLENSQQCPINDMIITNTKEKPLSFSSFSNVEHIQFNENTFLHYTNEAVNNHVIAEFAISRKKPCLANNEKDCDEDKSDPRFILLDTMDESVFYSENAFENKDKKKEKLSGTIKLYYRTYIGYDKNCKQNANFWENSNLFKNCNTIRQIIICVLSFAVGLYFCCGMLFCTRRKDEFEEKNNTDCAPDCSDLITSLIITSFGCLIAAEVISRKTKEIEGCSDEYFNSIIDAINSKKNKHEKYILGMHILITVFWFLSLALVCILCYNSHSRMSSPVSSPRYAPRWNVVPPPRFDKKEKKDDVVTTTAENVITKDDKEIKHVHPNENNKNVELKEIVINVEDSDIKMIKKITQKERIIKIIVLNDGRLLSIAKNTITIYNNEWEIEEEINESNELTSICQLDDGNLVTSHSDKTIKIRTIKNENKTVFTDDNIILSLISLSNSRFACSYGNKTIKIYVNEDRLKIVKTIQRDYNIESMFYYPDKNYFMVSTEDKQLYIYDGNTFNSFHNIQDFSSSIIVIGKVTLVYGNSEGIKKVSLREINQKELNEAIISENSCAVICNNDIAVIKDKLISLFDMKKGVTCILKENVHSLIKLNQKSFAAASDNVIYLFSQS